jgi:hypothetical protein
MDGVFPIFKTNFVVPKIVSDGNGGAIIAWTHNVGNSKVRAQRMDADGNRAWNDTSDVIINNTNGGHYRLSMISDGDGDAFMAWGDGRGPGNADIYMQHVKNDSTSSWTRNGILISDAQSYIPTPVLSAAPDSNVYVTWEDTRDNGNRLWTQRVHVDGNSHWQQQGVFTAKDVYNYSEHKASTSEEGSMIVAFTDQQYVYSKKIYPDASLGAPNTIEDDNQTVLNNYTLDQNYPNPFNPNTAIEFKIPNSQFVTLEIYNILGERVSTLLSAFMLSGSHKYEWDAREFASGVYYYQLMAGDFREIKKMVLLK